jgi:hypothetical protein
VRDERIADVKKTPKWVRNTYSKELKRLTVFPKSDAEIERLCGHLVLKHRIYWVVGDEVVFRVSGKPRLRAIVSSVEPIVRAGRLPARDVRFGFTVHWNPATAEKLF